MPWGFVMIVVLIVAIFKVATPYVDGERNARD